MQRAAEFGADDAFPGGRRAWWLCVVVLLVLGATRGRGAWYSYGLDGYSDEPEVIVPALNAAKGELRPERFLYPGWTAYTIGAAYRVLDLAGFGGEEGFLTPEPGPDHFVVGRLIVFATGLATVLVVALIGRRLFGPWAGLAGAALLLVSPEFTGMSYLVTVNTPASLWTALAVLFAARVYVGARRASDYVLAGVCAGFAVGCKYNSYPAAFPLAIAHLCAPRDERGWRHGWMVVGWGLVPLAFLVTTPFALFEFPRFYESVRFLNEVYRETNWPQHTSASFGSWGNYLDRIWRAGWPRELSVAALLGLLIAVTRDWRRAAIVVVAAVANLLFLGFYKVYFLRHLLPAIPALAVTSGVLVQRAVEVLDRRRPVPGRSLACAGVALLFVSGLGWRALAATEARVAGKSLLDSRQAALEWVLAYVPAGATIACEDRSPPIAERTDAYTLLPVRSIAAPEDRTAEVEARADYAIVTLMSERLIERDPAYAEAREIYQRFAARNELVAEFLGRGVDYSGRDIRIYRIQK